MHQLFAEDNFVFMDKFDIGKKGSGGAILLVALHHYWWLSRTKLQGADLTCCLVPNKTTKAAATFNFCSLLNMCLTT